MRRIQNAFREPHAKISLFRRFGSRGGAAVPDEFDENAYGRIQGGNLDVGRVLIVVEYTDTCLRVCTFEAVVPEPWEGVSAAPVRTDSGLCYVGIGQVRTRNRFIMFFA
jgi:hypothetical protein